MTTHHDSEDTVYTELSPSELQRWRSGDFPFINEIIGKLQKRGREAGKNFWCVRGDGDFELGEILLVWKVRIHRNEHFELILHRSLKQRAILNPSPAE